MLANHLPDEPLIAWISQCFRRRRRRRSRLFEGAARSPPVRKHGSPQKSQGFRAYDPSEIGISRAKWGSRNEPNGGLGARGRDSGDRTGEGRDCETILTGVWSRSADLAGREGPLNGRWSA